MTSRSQQLSGAWDPTNTAKQRAGRADRPGPEQNPTDSPTAPQRERADLSAPRPSCWRREIRLRLGRAGFWEGFSVLFFSIVSQFLVKSVSGLDLHQLGALDSVHGASSPGKRGAPRLPPCSRPSPVLTRDAVPPAHQLQPTADIQTQKPALRAEHRFGAAAADGEPQCMF